MKTKWKEKNAHFNLKEILTLLKRYHIENQYFHHIIYTLVVFFHPNYIFVLLFMLENQQNPKKTNLRHSSFHEIASLQTNPNFSSFRNQNTIKHEFGKIKQDKQSSFSLSSTFQLPNEKSQLINNQNKTESKIKGKKRTPPLRHPPQPRRKSAT